MEYPAMNSRIKEEEEEGEVEKEESEWGFVWRRSGRECGLVVEEVGQDSAGLWKVGITLNRGGGQNGKSKEAPIN